MADNFIQEMEEERRLQNLRIMACRAGYVLLALVVLGAVIGGAWAWHHHRLVLNRQEASDHYMQALGLLEVVSSPPASVTGGADSGNEEKEADSAQKSADWKKAEDLLADIAAHGPKGIRNYAAMHLAEMKYQQGDHKAALDLWQSVREDKKSEPALRGMASYLWLNAQSGSLPVGRLREGYQELVRQSDVYGGSWGSLAREGLVGLDLRTGATGAEKAEARRLLSEIENSPETPETLRQRAQILLQILSTTEAATSEGPENNVSTGAGAAIGKSSAGKAMGDSQ